jgi:hypothetical protein
MTATRRFRMGLMLAACLTIPFGSAAQEPSRAGDATGMSLRKSVQEREFRGRKIAGEEREIGHGDSLWRILIEEKGLPGKKFHSYLVIVRGLNPQIKNLDLLRIGDRLFVPLRAGDFGEVPPGAVATSQTAVRPGAGRTVIYRVKAGESLYRILRQEYKLSELRELAQYANLVKDLNPQRAGDWDTLHEGEILRLPALGATSASASNDIARPAGPITSSTKSEATAKERAAPGLDHAQVLRAPARANMPLFGSIVAAIGSEFQSSGEETIKLPDGTVHFDKSSYPVIYNAALRQRVVIDPKGDIPASLKSKLNDPSIGTPVIPMADGLRLQDAVKQLLAALGYKPLPNERPIVVQEGAIAFEAKGDWMALAPAVSSKTQDVFVVNLTDRSDEIPDYLQTELAKLGVSLRAVALPQNGAEPTQNKPEGNRQNLQVKNWPADKKELVDALLLSFGIPFGVAEILSVELSDGLRVDTRADRVFEINNKRVAIFFRRADPAIRKRLEERQGVRVVELELDSLSSRQVIARMLGFLGEPVEYREHRFSATQDPSQDRLTLKAWGFSLPDRAMFVTDREIPGTLHRFFFEKGLEIVYFR